MDRMNPAGVYPAGGGELLKGGNMEAEDTCVDSVDGKHDWDMKEINHDGKQHRLIMECQECGSLDIKEWMLCDCGEEEFDNERNL